MPPEITLPSMLSRRVSASGVLTHSQFARSFEALTRTPGKYSNVEFAT